MRLITVTSVVVQVFTSQQKEELQELLESHSPFFFSFFSFFWKGSGKDFMYKMSHLTNVQEILNRSLLGQKQKNWWLLNLMFLKCIWQGSSSKTSG